MTSLGYKSQDSNQIIEKVAPHRETKVRIRSVSGKTTFVLTFPYFSSTSLMDLVYSGVAIRTIYMPVGTGRPLRSRPFHTS